MSKTGTIEQAQEVVETFRAIDVYPTDIALQHGAAYDPRINDRPKTFSRYAWSNQPYSFFERQNPGPNESAPYLVRFTLNTLTTIGIGEAIPSEEEIPPERVIGTIAICFVLEYATSTRPATIDPLVLSSIEQTKVFDDLWPFWREALQSLSIRSRLPTPILPLRGVKTVRAIDPKSVRKPRKSVAKKKVEKQPKS